MVPILLPQGTAAPMVKAIRPPHRSGLCFVVFCLYSTQLPQAWAAAGTALACVTGISPLRGSLGAAYRSIMISRRGHGGAACHSCLGLSGYRSAPYLAVLECGDAPHRWSSRTQPDARAISKGIPVAGYDRTGGVFQGPLKSTSSV